VIWEGEESENRNVVRRRTERTQYDPLQCRALPLRPLRLLSHLAKPLPSGPWDPRHEPPPLQPALQQSRGAALQPQVQSPLQSTGSESSCPAVLVSGRWCAQLGKSSTELRAWLPLPFQTLTVFSLFLHLSVFLFLLFCSCCQRLWGWEFQLQSHTLIFWILSSSCVHRNKCPSFPHSCGDLVNTVCGAGE